MIFKLFEHTADIGIHVEANDLNTLFEEAACGLFAIIIENTRDIHLEQSVEIEVAAPRTDDLLLDWLNELLMQFELEKLVLNKFEVQIQGQSLKGKAFGEPIDPTRHQLTHEVKAITYCGLNVTRTSKGWLADVIVDI
jgi:SHS2 domain-containing protein